MTTLDLTATELLAKTSPAQLFSLPDPTRIHREYQKLVIKWHPDTSSEPLASEVLTHINMLHDQAAKLIDAGIWDCPGTLTLKLMPTKSSTKSFLTVNYKKKHSFELGEFFVGDNAVTYVIKPGCDDLVTNFINSVTAFTFPSDRMKEEMVRFLPAFGSIHTEHPPITSLVTLDGHKVIVVKKNPDQILLRDAVNKLGSLEPKHSAWVISRLLNIACYLEYNNQTLNDISLDTLYISPEFHTVTVLGGWWYSVPRGSNISVIPRRTLNLLPPKVLATKKASRRTDLELIRQVARDLQVDATPEVLKQWAKFPSSGSPKKDFAYWSDVALVEAFGPRKFIILDLKAAQVYPVI